MQVAILAGGLATRLRPLTERIPKSMVDVAGRPFLEHQLERLREHGVDDVVLCVGHLAHSIRSRFGDGSAFGVRIRYSDEADRRLGTAGALAWAAPVLEDVFFVLFGDSYLELDYGGIMAHFQARDRLALMVVHRNDNRWGGSDVAVREGFVTAYPVRPTPGLVYINAGLSVLRKAGLAGLAPGRPASLQDLYADLIPGRQVLAFETSQRFYEIGSLTGLEDLRRLLVEGGVPR